MADREATPEEAAAFHAANAPKKKALRGGVPANYPVPEEGQVLKFEDTPQPDDTARPLKTGLGVQEPGGIPAGDREATPEEVAAFHATPTPKPAGEQKAASAAAAAPAGTSTVADLRHEAYRGAIPLPTGAINAIEAFGNAHDPFNQHGNYDEELAKVEAREKATNTERPIASTVSRVAGALVPGAQFIKGGQAATAAAHGGADVLSRIGGAAMGAGTYAGLQGDNPAIAALAGAGGQAVGEGLSALASKFPWIADRLAERLTGQSAKQAASRIQGTVAGRFPAGDYAESTKGMVKLTPGATVRASQVAKDEVGAQLRNMRQGLSATPEELAAAIDPHPALDDLRDALKLGSSGGSTVDGLPISSLNSSILQRNPALAALMQGAKGGAVDLETLATETNKNVTNRLTTLENMQFSKTNPQIVDQREVRALQRTKAALNNLQDQKILGKGVDPGAYDAARKAYAIASGVNRGEARSAGQQAVRRGVGAVVGLVAGGHPFVGATVGDRPAAYAALKTYQALRNAPVKALAKAAQSATPSVAGAAARAKASGQPEQAGAAIQKAQANDPSSRIATDEDAEAARKFREGEH